MGTISYTVPANGQPRSITEPQASTALTTLLNWANGNVDTNNLNPAAGIVKGQLALGAGALTVRSVSAAATALSGQFIIASNATSYTVTLPAPAVNAIVGVVATGGGTGVITVATPSGLIGINAAGAASFPLGTVAANILLESDGTNWFPASGQQDSGWVPLTLPTNMVAAAGDYVPAARLKGDEVKLRGSVQNNTGGTVAAFATLATVPAGLRHSQAGGLSGQPVAGLPFFGTVGNFGGGQVVGVTSAGLVTVNQGVGNGFAVMLGNVAYSIN